MSPRPWTLSARRRKRFGGWGCPPTACRRPTRLRQIRWPEPFLSLKILQPFSFDLKALYSQVPGACGAAIFLVTRYWELLVFRFNCLTLELVRFLDCRSAICIVKHRHPGTDISCYRFIAARFEYSYRTMGSRVAEPPHFGCSGSFFSRAASAPTPTSK